MHGIAIKFCSNILVAKNNIPLPVPHILITAEIVYPKQKPLNATMPSTTGIPITVEPTNHIRKTNKRLLLSDFLSNSPLFTDFPFFKAPVKLCIYVCIS